MSAPKRCLEAGCDRHAIPGHSRCPPHQRHTYRPYNQRGYKTARALLLGLPCVRCGRPSDTADHVIPIARGGTWQDGLAPMCLACNSAKKDQ